MIGHGVGRWSRRGLKTHVQLNYHSKKFIFIYQIKPSTKLKRLSGVVLVARKTIQKQSEKSKRKCLRTNIKIKLTTLRS